MCFNLSGLHVCKIHHYVLTEYACVQTDAQSEFWRGADRTFGLVLIWVLGTEHSANDRALDTECTPTREDVQTHACPSGALTLRWRTDRASALLTGFPLAAVCLLLHVAVPSCNPLA